jgi:hypothetical protein
MYTQYVEASIFQATSSSATNQSPREPKSPYNLSAPTLVTPDNPLETLLLNLSLSSRNGSIRIRVLESTSILAGLERGRFSTADADAVQIGAAGGAAVCVGDTSASDELGAVARADIGGAGNVGLELGEGEGRDWNLILVWFL